LKSAFHDAIRRKLLSPLGNKVYDSSMLSVARHSLLATEC